MGADFARATVPRELIHLETAIGATAGTFQKIAGKKTSRPTSELSITPETYADSTG